MATQELPSDIVFEILSRATSLQTLATSICVSKHWKQQIIEDPSFLPTYCQRTGNLSGFYLQDCRDSKYVSMFASIDDPRHSSPIECQLPRGIRILASTNQGILLCCGQSQKKSSQYRYYVCKPSTGQWQALPNPKLRYWTEAVAMAVLGSSSLRFKIVRLSAKGCTKSYEHREYRCEIFDSASWTWREMQTLTLPSTEFIETLIPSIYVNGSFHWLTTHRNILAFNEPSESFCTFSLPESMVNDDGYGYSHKLLVNFQGRLGVSCMTQESEMELWLMESVGTETGVEWRKHMLVDMGEAEKSVTLPSPGGFYNAGIIFLLSGFYEAAFYKIGDGSISRVDLWDNGLLQAREIFQFKSDFETVSFRTIKSD